MMVFLFFAFISITAIQLFYYIFIFGKFAFDKESVPEEDKTIKSISVIVCAKNQMKNMTTLIPQLVSQDYPDYEVVLINNASSDDTMDLFKSFEEDYPNIKIVNIENNETFWGNKKYSLTLGIKAATKEYLLFIEPDCYPASKEWIRTMSAKFTSRKTIVLGYSGYEKVEKSFLNKIIRFDSVLNALQYFSWAKTGKPYTGNGKNIAYKKENFFETNGFINHIKIKSGEAELFINESATEENTAICCDPENFTYSKTPNHYKNWYDDKSASFDIVKHFKTPDLLRLILFEISQLLFLILALILLLFQFNRITVLLLLIIRYSISFFVLWTTAKKLNEKEVLYWYPLVEVVIIYTQFSIFAAYFFNATFKFINTFSKALRWKLRNR